jgi:heme-degrading monooxygenase HmoA
MIVRIVKMTFLPGREQQFLGIFASSKDRIRNFHGCSHLELLRDKDDPGIFFTYSHWETEDHLLNYRNSSLFKEVWGQVSPLFRTRPEAWTTQKTA